jgi:membrane protease YdiL (CAAX protease family)
VRDTKVLRPPPQCGPRAGGRAKLGATLAGLGLLCAAIPLLRDLLVRERPGSGPAVAALGYAALLGAGYIAMRLAKISWAEVGVRALTLRSILLGIGAGIVVVAPVWRLPVISVSGASWLLIAVAVEEIAFRGVLYAVLLRTGGVPLAIGGSALAFTVAHAAGAGWPSLVLVALAGLYLGLLRAIRGDLWTSGLAHLLMDLVSLP